MKLYINLILTFLMSTTFVFAKQARTNLDSEISKVLNASGDMQSNKSINSCNPRTQRYLLKTVNKSINKEKRNPTTLETAIKRYQIKYSNTHYKTAKKTNRILKRNRKLNRYYRKIKKNNPETTFKGMVADMKESMTKETRLRGLANVETTLVKAGSLLNHLEDLKLQIADCSINQKLKGGDTWAIIQAVIFIGLPVIAILSLIITLIMGAWAWALGLLIFAVVMLGIFVIIGQFGSKNLTYLKPEKEKDITPITDDKKLIA